MAFVKFIFVILILIPVAILMLYLINRAIDDIPKKGDPDYVPDKVYPKRKGSNRSVIKFPDKKKKSKRASNRSNKRGGSRSGRSYNSGAAPQHDFSMERDWSSRLSNHADIEPPMSSQRKSRE